MKRSNQKGFTLIEVVLVLAIGGLIFLLAFLAFQQVSRNRRDTQRRSDAGRVVAEIQNYRGDANGAVPANVTTGGLSGASGIAPATANTFFNNYMGGANFAGPRGAAYTVVASTATPTSASVDQITYVINTRCNGSSTTASTGNVAVLVGLENGGVACRDDR